MIWGTNAATGQIVTGAATLNVTHIAVKDLPKGTTLEAPERHQRYGDQAGMLTEFRPEPATHMKIQGHDAIAWQVTKEANGSTVKTYEVSVFVGGCLYDFHLQAGGVSDFSSLVEAANRMLVSVKFR